LIEYAKKLGIEFIICDHHLPDSEIPDAVAVLDPNKKIVFIPIRNCAAVVLGSN
jgi:single-stranded-DNA-specific exonuclease